MRLPSVIAIYVLFWAMCFFLVLPFSPGTRGDAAPVPGQAESAPPTFSFPRACAWTTLVSAAIFGLFYLNYVYGWITPERVNLVPDRVIEGSSR